MSISWNRIGAVSDGLAPADIPQSVGSERVGTAVLHTHIPSASWQLCRAKRRLGRSPPEQWAARSQRMGANRGPMGQEKWAGHPQERHPCPGCRQAKACRVNVIGLVCLRAILRCAKRHRPWNETGARIRWQVRRRADTSRRSPSRTREVTYAIGSPLGRRGVGEPSCVDRARPGRTGTTPLGSRCDDRRWNRDGG